MAREPRAIAPVALARSGLFSFVILVFSWHLVL